MLKGDVDDLIHRLKEETYIKEMIVRPIIADWAIDYMAEMGRLQAKVTAYEAIISNSNFKMAVEETKESNNAD